MRTNKILNINILSVSTNQLLESLSDGVLVTPNVDHLVKLQKDRMFYDSYCEANWVLCDSKVVNLVSHFLGNPFTEVIPGSSFFPNFYNYHRNNKNIKIFLLGAAEGVARKAMDNINKKVGWNIVVAAHSPSFGFENNESECLTITNLINSSGCNVLVVGVGAPKQEKWIAKHRHELPSVKLFMALGATIDFEAGSVKRAPMIFRKLTLEWLYRMFTDPRRLIKRYLIDDLPFFYYIIRQKLGQYKNPFEV